MEPIQAYGYFVTAANKPLERREFSIDSIQDDQVLVKVAGCGLCHTDISFLSGQVQTRHEFPLVLGHEISGKVIAAGASYAALEGKNVVIPAVMPCGACELCKSGRDNICQHQQMPGNDFNGGFASHIVVPGRSLCVLPANLNGFDLAQLSVVADAITTPYQSLKRSGLKSGDLAIVIGAGGIGIYMVQHAKNAGAKVIALDIDADKLAAAAEQGAHHTICVKGMDEREIKKQIRELVRKNNLPEFRWKVFETSGSGAGQQTAFSLLTFAGTVGIIGFTMEKLQVRLSNIMAFDADVFGNWGCSPSHYPAVVRGVLDGAINLRENTETFPLDSINDVIGRSLNHQLKKRAIFTP